MKIPLLAMPMIKSQILKSVNFTKSQKFRYLENKTLFSFQIKKRDSLNHASSSPLDYFSLHSALCNTFNVIRIKILQVIGKFLQIGGPKIQIYQFWLKIDKHGLLMVLFLNLHLQFSNSNLKINFWANSGKKTQSSPFFLLPKNRLSWYLEDADSYSDITFINFQS